MDLDNSQKTSKQVSQSPPQYLARYLLSFNDMQFSIWDRKTNHKKNIASPLQYSSAVLINDKNIFFTGGYEKSHYLRDVKMCKVEEYETIKPMQSMIIERAYHGLANCRNVILYACAGCQEHDEFTGKCEKYIIKENKWLLCPRMVIPVYLPGCIVMNEIIYITGGFNRTPEAKGIQYLNAHDEDSGWQVLEVSGGQPETKTQANLLLERSINQLTWFNNFETNLDIMNISILTEDKKSSEPVASPGQLKGSIQHFTTNQKFNSRDYRWIVTNSGKAMSLSMSSTLLVYNLITHIAGKVTLNDNADKGLK